MILKNRMRPIHPGEILSEGFLKPMGVTVSALAERMHVSVKYVSGIIVGTRSITADTALSLSSALGTTAELWMNLQQAYDLRRAELDRGSDAGRVKRSRVKRSSVRATMRDEAVRWLMDRANPESQGGMGAFADTRFSDDLTALLEKVYRRAVRARCGAKRPR